jgi:16S rRNA (guanine966-N2)-methyltransferase
VREALFSTLTSRDAVDGATALDLFAGTGALGIEALSRGATSATFVDADHAAIAAIHTNLRATHLEAHATVVQADVLAFLDDGARTNLFDLAFADPPYAFDAWATLLARLRARTVALESDRPVPLPDGWRLLVVKRYGGTVVTLAAPE